MNEDDWIEYPEHANVRRDVKAALEADYHRMLAHLSAKPRGPRQSLWRRLLGMWTGN